MEETSEQHLDKCIKAMGPKLGECFHEVHVRVIWVSGVWKQHQKLFQKDRETSLLLERRAAVFFNVVYEELWDSTLLWLCKLLDEASSAGNKNLTLGTLTMMVVDQVLRSELQRRFDSLKELATIIRLQRRKRIAHLDRPYAMKESHAPDQLIAATDVNAVIDGIQDFMELIRESHEIDRYDYDKMYWIDDAENLLEILWASEVA